MNLFAEPKYRLLLFDFDLTLADGSDWIVACYQQMLCSHGFNDVSNNMVKQTIGMTVENSISQMTGITDVNELAELRAEYRNICRPRMAEHTKLFSDAKSFLEKVYAQGFILGIISTKQSFVIRQSLKNWNIENLFSLVYGLDEVLEPKPSPIGIERAGLEIGVSQNEILYFGDSEVDAQTAQRANVDFVGVLKGNHTKSDLQEFPHICLIDNYEELYR